MLATIWCFVTDKEWSKLFMKPSISHAMWLGWSSQILMYFVGWINIIFNHVTAFVLTPLHFPVSIGVNNFPNVVFYWNGFWSFWELL